MKKLSYPHGAVGFKSHELWPTILFLFHSCAVFALEIVTSQETSIKFALKCRSSVPTLLNWWEVILSLLAIAHSSMKLQKHYTGFAPRRHPPARNDLSQKVRWRLFDYSWNSDKLSMYKSAHWPETTFLRELSGQYYVKLSYNMVSIVQVQTECQQKCYVSIFNIFTELKYKLAIFFSDVVDVFF